MYGAQMGSTHLGVGQFSVSTASTDYMKLIKVLYSHTVKDPVETWGGGSVIPERRKPKLEDCHS